MSRKLVSLSLILFMVLGSFAKTNFIYAEDDETPTQDKSDYDRCIEDRDKEACAAVAQSAQDSLKEIENKIADAKNDRDSAVALAEEYAKRAQSLQGEIDSLKAQIEELKVRIDELVVQIEENEAKVEEINTRVKNRMVETQKIMHFNGYIEFILGSKSFTDMLSRVYGVEAIVSKDKNDRETLVHIIEQLTRDKEELDAAGVPYVYMDITGNLMFLKKFLKLREGAAFAAIRERGQIGIPCLQKEDGTITFDWKEFL